MAEMRYTKEHEWLLIEGTTGTVGITAYAAGQLGDVVFVELPAAGKNLAKGDEAAVVESVKAASEVYAPAAGTVTAVNDTLEGDPALVNRDPEGDGWFFKLDLSNGAEAAEMMDASAYKDYLEGLD